MAVVGRSGCSTLTTSSRDVSGLETEYEYDDLGRPTFIQSEEDSDAAWTNLWYGDSGWTTGDFRWDSAGNVLEMAVSRLLGIDLFVPIAQQQVSSTS